MEEYKLGYDEVVLVEPFGVFMLNKFNNPIIGEIVLTNKYIIVHFFKLVFNKKKTISYDKYLIKDVKIYENKAQCIYDGKQKIKIYLKNQILEYGVRESDGAKRFVSEINKLLTGNEVVFENPKPDPRLLTGTEKIANKLANTINVFRSTLTEPNSTQGHPQVYRQIITSLCPGCGAQLTGVKGDFVKCQYCGRQEKL